MKDHCEGDEFTPSLSVDDYKINEKKSDVVNDDNGYFLSDTKEEHISYLTSSFEIPNEVEDKPPPAGCELGNMKENNLMQREEHSYEFCTLWKQDEVETTLEVRV